MLVSKSQDRIPMWGAVATFPSLSSASQKRYHCVGVFSDRDQLCHASAHAHPVICILTARIQRRASLHHRIVASLHMHINPHIRRICISSLYPRLNPHAMPPRIIYSRIIVYVYQRALFQLFHTSAHYLGYHHHCMPAHISIHYHICILTHIFAYASHGCIQGYRRNMSTLGLASCIMHHALLHLCICRMHLRICLMHLRICIMHCCIIVFYHCASLH